MKKIEAVIKPLTPDVAPLLLPRLMLPFSHHGEAKRRYLRFF